MQGTASLGAEGFCRRWGASARTVGYKPELARIAGGDREALLLSQILYWFSPAGDGRAKTTVERDGVRWLAKPRREWLTELGIGKDKLDRAMAGLVSRGLVRTELRHFQRVPTPHIAVEWEALRDRLTRPGAEEVEAVEESASISRPCEVDFAPARDALKEESTCKDYKNPPYPSLSPAEETCKTPDGTSNGNGMPGEVGGCMEVGGDALNAVAGMGKATAGATATAQGRRERRSREEEPAVGSEAALLAAEAERVLLLCGVSDTTRRLRLAVGEALRLRMLAVKCSVGEASDLAVRRWKEYAEHGPALRYAVGVRKFFGDGVWLRPGLWPYDREMTARIRRGGL